MSLPDYSEYLNKPGMLAYIESEWLTKPDRHELYSEVVNKYITNHGTRVLEIGCATGNVAKHLKPCFYHGFDLNADCIDIARAKVPNGFFYCGDVRSIDQNFLEDIVCAFAILKHFGLHEWKEIFKKISSFGELFIFDIPISYLTHDDGTEFHHVWKSGEDIKKDIKDIGFEIVEVINGIEPIFVTKRK